MRSPHFFLITLLFFFSSTLTHAQDAEVIVIKLKPQYASIIEANAGMKGLLHKNSGIDELNTLNNNYMAKDMKRVFSPVKGYEKAHRAYGLHLWYEITLPAGTSSASLVTQYYNLNSIEYCELKREYRMINPVEDVIPEKQISAINEPTTDPDFNLQWHYKNTGQTGGTSGADINLEPAWLIETGSTEVIVAVIDQGIDHQHPDLSSNMWVNSDEIPDNGIDDDSNGYIDDVYGYGFGDNSGTIYPGYHGTHVGGTIAAVTNNELGVAGIAGGSGTGNGVRLMSCASFGEFSQGRFEDAMIYAADNGAVISQNSWGGGSMAIEAAIDYFIERAGYDNTDDNFDLNIQTGPMAGGIVIFAAGNSNSSNPSIGYPASYEPNLAVASTDHNDLKSSFSNYGDWVDISAPGSNVYSTYPTGLGGYAYLSGTSMACPHVSGVAALIISKFGGEDFTPIEVRGRLTDMSDDIDYLNPSYENLLGSGRLNAANSLLEKDSIPPDPIEDLMVDSVTFNTITLAWTATGGSKKEGVASRYDIRFSTTPITDLNFDSMTEVQNPPRPAISGETQTFTIEELEADTEYYFALKAYDFFGFGSDISNVATAITSGPPHAAISPDSVAESLITGEISTQELILDNSSGESPLTYYLSKNYKDEAEETFIKRSMVLNKNIIQSTKKYDEGIYKNAIKKNFQVEIPKITTSENISAASGRLFYVTSNSNYIVEINLTDGSTINYFNAPENISGGPDGLAFDGTNLYFINSFGTKTIYKINASNGEIIDTFEDHRIEYIDALGYANNSLFALDYSNDLIYELDFDAKVIVDTLSIGQYIGGGITFGGSRQSIFVSNFDEAIYEVDYQTGSIINSFLPQGTIYGLGYSEKSNILFAANAGNGKLEALNPDDGSVIYELNIGGISALASDESSFYQWLNFSKYRGIIPSGQQEIIDLSFDSKGLYGGLYEATITLNSNDPANPSIETPVTLKVTGAPDIAISPDSLDFGEVFINTDAIDTLIIANEGTDTLQILSIASDNPKFSIDTTEFWILPEKIFQLPITYYSDENSTDAAQLEITSNDHDEGTLIVKLVAESVYPPDLIISTDSIYATLFTGDTTSQHFTISNETGGSQLDYSISFANYSSNLLSIIENKSFESQILQSQAQNNQEETIYQSVVSGPGLKATEASPDLSEVLLNLENNYKKITNAIPNRYDFTEGISGNNISDGGDNMFDVGNYIQTNYLSGIPYTDRQITSSSGFQNGSYFTAKYPGLFVMAADLNNIYEFGTYGNLGANGNGNVDASVLSIVRNGRHYFGFVKRVYHAGVPSVNHLIIVESNGPIYHNISTYSDSDYQMIYDISNCKRVYYLLYAGKPDIDNGFYIGDESTLKIMENFLSIVDIKTDWISISPQNSSIENGLAEELTVSFSATGLDDGEYDVDVMISSNDPEQSIVRIPAHLEVIKSPDIKLSKDSINFNQQFIGTLSTDSITISNLGSDTLKISKVHSVNPDFLLDQTSFNIPPKSAANLNITYSPADVEIDNSHLYIINNDFDKDSVVVELFGSGVDPPKISISPDSIGESLLTDETSIRKLLIDNTEGGSELLISATTRVGINIAQFKNLSQNELAQTKNSIESSTDTEVSPTLKEIGDEKVLIIQNSDAWGVNMSNFIFNNYGISAMVIGYQSLDTMSLDKFDIIITVGDQTSYYYNSISDNVAKFEQFVENGGILQYQLATQGSDVQLVGNVNMRYGNLENYNEIKDSNHQIVHDLPDTLNGNYANHCYLENLPIDANIIVTTLSSDKPTLVEYQYGSGTIIATGMTVEYLYNNGYNGGPILGRMFEYSQELADISWLSINITSDTIPAGQSKEYDVTFNASDLYGGLYKGEIILNTNDPDNLKIKIPASLLVTGVPELTLSADSINFGEQFLNTSTQKSIVVSNTGTDTLLISNIYAKNTDFSIDTTKLKLVPEAEYELNISYAPQEIGSDNTELVFVSNNAIEDTIFAKIYGIGVDPPIIEVHPDSFSEHLISGESSVQQLTIDNSNGGSVLNYRIENNYLNNSIPAKVNDTGIDYSNYPRIERQKPDKISSTDHSIKDFYQGDSLAFGISSYGEVIPYQFPLGVEHLQYGTYISGYSVFYNDGLSDKHAYAAYDSRSGLAPVAYLVKENTTERLEVEVITRTMDNQLRISRTIGFNKHSAAILVETKISNIGDEPLTNLVYKSFADWDINNSAASDNWEYDIENNILIASENSYHTIAGDRIPDYYDIDGWDDYLVRETDEDVLGPITSFDGLEVLHYELGELIQAESTTLQHVFVSAFGKDQLIDLVNKTLTNKTFLSFDPISGSISAGNSEIIDVTFDATGLSSGVYTSNFSILSNDPINPVVNIPATLTVTGFPSISASRDSVNFGENYVGSIAQDSLFLTNTGTDTLVIKDIYSQNPDYSTEYNTNKLPIGASAVVFIHYSPSEAGSDNSILNIVSNDPGKDTLMVKLYGSGVNPPLIKVSPESIDDRLLVNDSSYHVVTIDNTLGGSPLTFEIDISTDQGITNANILENKVFQGDAFVNDNKTEDYTLPKADEIYKSTIARSEFIQSSDATELSMVLDALDITYTTITDLIPNRYDFSGGESGNSISDGGGDMYDGGNFLSTNISDNINYSNKIITQHGALNNEQYFTAKYPGLFLFAANLNNVSEFIIDGNLGADGSGNADGSVLAVTWKGRKYLGFVKRVSGSWDPSINHLIIIEDNGVAQHQFSTNTNVDYHSIYNLDASTRLYYLLFAGSAIVDNGYYIDDTHMLSIMESFLKVAENHQNWLTSDINSGTIDAGATQDITIKLNSKNLDLGFYNGKVQISSNDPDNSDITIPVALEVIKNIPPIGADHLFEIEENPVFHQTIGFIEAIDPEDEIKYYLLAGKESSAFELSRNGELFVSDVAMFDFETNAELFCDIMFTDGEYSDTLSVTVNILDVEENKPPIGIDQRFEVKENIHSGFVIGQIEVDDPGDSISYELLGGKDFDAFQISPEGKLLVADSTLFDYETHPQLICEVMFTDGEYTDTLVVTVNVMDVEENNPPIGVDQSFEVEENINTGFVIGQVIVDDPGDLIYYEILPVKNFNAFEISDEGILSVADSTSFDYEINHNLYCDIKFSDLEYSDTLTVTIQILDISENTPPFGENQEFSIEENSIQGTVIDTVQATDNEDIINFYLLAGKNSHAFKLSKSGVLSIADHTLFDYETHPQLTCDVMFTDGIFKDTLAVIVNVLDLDDELITGIGLMESKVKIFPNPTSGLFTIKSSNDITEIHIVNINGKIIYSKTHEGIKHAKVDIQNEPNGSYILILKEKNGIVERYNIIKMK